MNWKLLGALFLVLIIYTSSIVALIAYVRHWARRQKMLIKPIRVTEGLFFKRYIPPSLYLEYDRQRIKYDRIHLRYLKIIRRSLVSLITLAAVSLVIGFLYFHQDMYFSTPDRETHKIKLSYSNKIKNHVGLRDM